MQRSFQFITALAALLLSRAAMAHVGLHSAGGFTAGFLAATAALHALGVSAGALLRRHSAALHLGGAAISLIGASLVLSM